MNRNIAHKIHKDVKNVTLKDGRGALVPHLGPDAEPVPRSASAENRWVNDSNVFAAPKMSSKDGERDASID